MTGVGCTGMVSPAGTEVPPFCITLGAGFGRLRDHDRCAGQGHRHRRAGARWQRLGVIGIAEIVLARTSVGAGRKKSPSPRGTGRFKRTAGGRADCGAALLPDDELGADRHCNSSAEERHTHTNKPRQRPNASEVFMISPSMAKRAAPVDAGESLVFFDRWRFSPLRLSRLAGPGLAAELCTADRIATDRRASTWPR